MRTWVFLFIFAFAGSGALLHAQDSSPSPKDLISEGNSLLQKEQFSAALTVWLEVLKQSPASADANFKAGLCYRNMFGEHEKALPYFKEAAENISHKYKFTQEEAGQSAPVDALFFLGETYLKMNKTDSALALFLDYENRFNGNPPIQTDRYIRMCINSRFASKSPRDVTLKNMGDAINSGYAETNPVLTLDNSVLFFSSRRLRKDLSNQEQMDRKTGSYPEDIYFAVKGEDGKWENIQLFKHSSGGNDAPLALSADGLTLYIRSDKSGNYNFYESHFRDGVWEEPVALGSGINSPFDETGLSVSGDGQNLFIASDRKGGEGGSDLYHCARKKNGKWSKPRNLGNTINTALHELSPFVHPNGKTLFFSANGYKSGTGGYDVYYTELKEDGTWSDPQNIGYPINTTRDDINYYISSGGLRYMASLNSGKNYDLYSIEGGGFNFENIDQGTQVVTLTKEMDVTEVLEVEKQVEKEVEVVEIVETEVVVEKEVEVVDATPVEEIPAEEPPAPEEEPVLAPELIEEPPAEEKPDPVAEMIDTLVVENLRDEVRSTLVEKLKKYLFESVEQNQKVTFKTVYFDFNSSTLSVLSRDELQAIVEYSREHPEHKIEIIGHADNLGKWEINLRYSQERAKRVHKYLLAKGVSPRKLNFYGKGHDYPIANNDTEEGRKLNRRVEIVVSK